MSKKSDKKEKKAVKEEKKHGKKNKASNNIRVIKDYLKANSDGSKILLDMESRFHINFNVQEAKIKKDDGTYFVRIGMPKDETLLLVSVARSASEMLPADYIDLNYTISSKVRYLPEDGMVECCVVMLLDNQLSEKQLNWSVHKLIMDCDYSVFYSAIHRKPSETEEPYPEDEPEETAPAEEDASDILDRLLSASSEKSESEPHTEPADEAPTMPDGTVTAEEEMKSVSILSKLIKGALRAAESSPEPETGSEQTSESGNADKKSDEDFVSVSKTDMLEALFGKKPAEPEKPAPEDSPETPDDSDTPDDTDTPPDDNDGE